MSTEERQPKVNIPFVYLCPQCYAILPYYNANHHCPVEADDEGFFERDPHLHNFVTWYSRYHSVCLTLTQNRIRYIYQCSECDTLLLYPKCPHECFTDENDDLAFFEGPEEIIAFHNWLEKNPDL